jgi:hypothetical protein
MTNQRLLKDEYKVRSRTEAEEIKTGNRKKHRQKKLLKKTKKDVDRKMFF